jgi:hypothetical protein
MTSKMALPFADMFFLLWVQYDNLFSLSEVVKISTLAKEKQEDCSSYLFAGF